MESTHCLDAESTKLITSPAGIKQHSTEEWVHITGFCLDERQRCSLMMSATKNETQARFHVLYLLRAQCFFFFLLYFCAQKTSQSESPHRDCSSRIQRHTMAKTKVGKKQGAELCTVNIFFKNNTRTKMFLLNQILFLVKYNKINSIK